MGEQVWSSVTETEKPSVVALISQPARIELRIIRQTLSDNHPGGEPLVLAFSSGVPFDRKTFERVAGRQSLLLDVVTDERQLTRSSQRQALHMFVARCRRRSTVRRYWRNVCSVPERKEIP